VLFESIIGQNGPVSILKKALQYDRIPTAYLFTGPPGCGRTMAARAVAASLNCREGNTACGKCPSCRLYAAGNHPDLHLVGLREGKRQIVIEQVKEAILERAYLKPAMGETSTFIITDAHLLNMSASNAFLKTLEEPPETSHFILIAPDRDSVLPTIASRCQTLTFSPLPKQTVKEILLREGIQEEETAFLAAVAKGSIKRARSYHSDGAMRSSTEEFDHLCSFGSYGIGQLLDLSQRWSRNRQETLEILEFLAQWYRDMMILAEGVPEAQVVHLPYLKELREGASKVGGRNLTVILESVENAREDIEANTNIQLTLDTLLFKIRSQMLEESPM